MKFISHLTTQFSRIYVLLALSVAAVVSIVPVAPAAYAESPYTYTQYSNPTRTVVTDSSGQWVATFSDGARTVSLRGPSRTFSEPSAASPFVSTTWVRILPAPFTGTVDAVWLGAALADTSPDIIAISMQYIENAPALTDTNGRNMAGDADYGPIDPATGARLEGSDFNDYLGIAWLYGGTTDNPESDQINSLDCSGYIRMVWGYRGGLPLTLNPNGTAIPRRSFQILDSAPGVVIVPNSGAQVTDLTPLAVGDLVFFDADSGDGAQIDHIGMYIGRDVNGRYRFISSRKTINGPTFGTDFSGQGGKSILDGSGYWAVRLRAVRRF